MQQPQNFETASEAGDCVIALKNQKNWLQFCRRLYVMNSMDK